MKQKRFGDYYTDEECVDDLGDRESLRSFFFFKEIVIALN